MTDILLMIIKSEIQFVVVKKMLMKLIIQNKKKEIKCTLS